jgi:hypothetical protein
LETSLLEPLFFLTSSIFISVALLFFFSEKIFEVWLGKFMIWFFPLSLIIIAIGSVEVNYGTPTRSSLSIFMGSIMVGVTLIIALTQRFYFNRKS